MSLVKNKYSINRYISKVDSERFGFKVARINHFLEPVSETIAQFESLGVRLVISRVPTEAVQLINEMEDRGFKLKDVQVTYNLDINKKSPQLNENSFRYREYRTADYKAVVSIAAESFTNYGHYSNNKSLDFIDSSAIYADWASRCCQKEGLTDYIIIAEGNKEIAGFLALKILCEGPIKYAVGVMGAVSDKHSGLGVFRHLNIAGLVWAAEKDLNRVEHNVLVSNYPVNKTYSSLGFNIIRSEITFHCQLYT